MNKRVILVFAVLLFSCTRASTEYEIKLPETPPLSRPVIGYGVIGTNYTHVLDKQDVNGKSLGFLRKGAIVEVIERRSVLHGGVPESWVFVKGTYSGWLLTKDMRIFPSLAQAKTASKQISQ
ncbi:MAG: hypothetical protein LBV52_06095 [Spirochaetaceae bacterium]|jgi:hypothetical protein|nr:hypothetical protein [Spirochaetaceae bacterium]